MAVIDDPRSPVEIASQEDLGRAIDRELERAGVSLEELRQQAAADDFVSEQAEQAWFILERLARNR